MGLDGLCKWKIGINLTLCTTTFYNAPRRNVNGNRNGLDMVEAENNDYYYYYCDSYGYYETVI